MKKAKKKTKRHYKPKISSYLYTEATYINKKADIVKAINPPYLFSLGKYKTKIKVEDLPSYYIKVFYRYLPAYINARDVVDLVFNVSLDCSDTLKYDYVYISYNKKFNRDKLSHMDLIFESDVSLFGYDAYDFVRAVLALSKIDISIELEKIKNRFLQLNNADVESFKRLIDEPDFYKFFNVDNSKLDKC